MLRRLRTALMACCVLATPFAVGAARANDIEELAPFKMIRSLQYVQDSVVLGDHSAIEMQRFMLGAIDKRLRDTVLPALPTNYSKGSAIFGSKVNNVQIDPNQGFPDLALVWVG